jgi:hypothetical protein
MPPPATITFTGASPFPGARAVAPAAGMLARPRKRGDSGDAVVTARVTTERARYRMT